MRSIAVGTYVYPVAAMSCWAGIDLAFIPHYGWAGLSCAPAGDSHTGVAVDTYVHPVAAMSCGQALALPSFKGMADSTMRQSSDGDAAR